MQEKLHQNDLEFEPDMIAFNAKMVDRNESFNREFKHDMDGLGKSIADRFRDNAK